MGRTRRREAIAAAARAAGLGELVRLHRGHGNTAVARAVAIAVGVGALPVWIATFVLWKDHDTTWQWPLLVWACLAGFAYLLLHLGPVRGGRHWVGLAQHGLVLWSGDRTGDTVKTVTWAEANVLGNTRVCGRGDLRASILRGAPVGPWSGRRITVAAAIALATAAMMFFVAVPIAAHLVVGERPHAPFQLARVCQGGEGFGGSTGYRGPGPHPAVVFGADGSWDYSSVPEVQAAEVQLVGCVARVERGPLLRACSYERGYFQSLYLGRYLVTVVEVRTGRVVGSFSLDGERPEQSSLECAHRIIVHSSQDPVSYTEPAQGSYRAELARFVDAMLP
ncbi:hypothetical protein M8C13_24270 [Crossiella sp. SN42]|uniref:hypothetical protein n=1 Tax=Crossiella sp. SN42 TaxID=2944808 RepID=UPI00207CAD6C|nr:hypothetical protein [Crossiella sp. SN42]MCO1578875.1 hypothetical protein [Crossiella sp. SN42]